MPYLSIAIRSMPMPKAKPWIALGVVAVLAHVAEDVGVDHAGAEDLQPARALADAGSASRRSAGRCS